MEQDFDLFDFAASQQASEQPNAHNGGSTAKTSLSKAELRQAALAFLVSLKPAGIAANVPTRRSKYKVAAAGFWRPATSRKTNIITRTAIVVMYDDLDCCFSDCADREQRIAVISARQEEKA